MIIQLFIQDLRFQLLLGLSECIAKSYSIMKFEVMLAMSYSSLRFEVMLALCWGFLNVPALFDISLLVERPINM